MIAKADKKEIGKVELRRRRARVAFLAKLQRRKVDTNASAQRVLPRGRRCLDTQRDGFKVVSLVLKLQGSCGSMKRISARVSTPGGKPGSNLPGPRTVKYLADESERDGQCNGVIFETADKVRIIRTIRDFRGDSKTLSCHVLSCEGIT
jgi:hypothetical protein